MPITITKTAVYLRQPPAAGSPYPEAIVGSPPAPDLVDHRLEDHDLRQGLEGDQGNLCITVQPGEKLGEVYVNIQFEGKIHDYVAGTCEQNKHLGHAADDLHELLGAFAAEYEAEIAGMPCPESKDPMALAVAAARLELGRVAEAQKTIQPPVDVTVNRKPGE